MTVAKHSVAVITGAASGLGFALAKVCCDDGMHVILADINKASLSQAVEYLKSQYTVQVFGVLCDVAQPQDLLTLADTAFSYFNHVNLLINNAGIVGSLMPIWEMPINEIEAVMDVNMKGVIHGIQAFLPPMREQSSEAHIVNIASVYGVCSGSNIGAYSMSKHAVIALSESLYFDLRRLNCPVNVSVVCPSFISTNLLRSSESQSDAAVRQMLDDLLKHSRLPEDVAQYILKEVQNKKFYILPDKEIKDYCQQKTHAIIEEDKPYQHNLEKIMCALTKRAQ